jgi:hypothetical protein
MSKRDSTFSRPEEVLVSEGDDNFIVLDYQNGFYYGLDEVGKKIFRRLESRKSVNEIVEELSREYDAPQEVLHRDVTEFISQLLKANLIKTGS